MAQFALGALVMLVGIFVGAAIAVASRPKEK